MNIMRTYGVKRRDRVKCFKKNCSCCDWHNKYPFYISKRKGNKNRARKKSARQALKFQQL